jgi:spermidine synthase
MVCHGELYRLRPEPRHLTSFFLLIAAGGAVGGILATAVAPLVFPDYYELHWGLVLCAALFLIACLVNDDPQPEEKFQRALESWRWPACVLPVIAFAALDWFIGQAAIDSKALTKTGVLGLRLGLWIVFTVMAISWVARREMKTFLHWRALASAWLVLGTVSLAVALWVQVRDTSNERIYTSRNFYGVLSVFEHRRDEPEGHHFRLQHGRITHGIQFVSPDLAHEATTYYAESSGVGLAVRVLPAGPRRIGVVGLGTGSMAVYGRTGDYLRIYEINPEVKKLATSRFTYVPDCPAAVEVAMGDARLSMEREPPEQFDLLVLDAFSSDAIPVHLLTREAFQLYERHMKPKGIICVHISNHYLNLEPVVANLAKQFGLKSGLIDFEETDEEWWLYSSSWILLTHDQPTLDLPQIRSSMTALKSKSSVPLWTDDFASLFQILRK